MNIKTIKLIDANGKIFGVNQEGGDLIIRAKALGYTGASFQLERLDPSTLAKNTIDYAHHKVHEGETYCASVYEADFDKAEQIGIIFRTPDTNKHLHVMPNVYASSAALFQICEAPTMDVGEYSVTFQNPMNRDRNSSNTSAIRSWRAAPVVGEFSHKVAADAAPVTADAAPVTADGTLVHSEVIGSGKQGGGGPTRDTGEFVLKRNTTYYFRLAGTTQGADNSIASLELVWYEHEPIE